MNWWTGELVNWWTRQCFFEWTGEPRWTHHISGGQLPFFFCWVNLDSAFVLTFIIYYIYFCYCFCFWCLIGRVIPWSSTSNGNEWQCACAIMWGRMQVGWLASPFEWLELLNDKMYPHFPHRVSLDGKLELNQRCAPPGYELENIGVSKKLKTWTKLEGRGASTLHLLCTLCTAWIYGSWAQVSGIKGSSATIFLLSAFRVRATCNNYPIAGLV